jgi:beta-N-acetylhexosaminidase
VSPDHLRRLALRVQLPGFAGTSLDPGTHRLLAEGLGGVCLFGSNTADGPEALQELVGAVHDAASQPVVVAVDEEGGDVTRLHAATGSPHPGAAVIGAVDDLAWTGAVAREIGSELAALGISMTLGPVADLNSEPDNPVIGIRSMGTDPGRVAAHVAAWVEGLQQCGVSACAKHFPGHGDTRQDSHLEAATLGVDLATLHRRELVPFTAAVQAGADAVMTGHLVVPALDAERPASLSPAAHALLRTELHFAGAVVTDALDMAGVCAGRGIAEAAVQALVAGADLLCLGQATGEDTVRAVQDAVVAAVHAGRLTQDRLTEAAGRVDVLHRDRAPLPLDSAGERLARHAGVLRRALVVEGEIGSLEGALCLTVVTEPSVAVGAVPWGLPADLVVTSPDLRADELVAGAAGRPVVLQVRDGHRHPAVSQLVDALGAVSRVVVVEWGWPGPWPGSPRVCAFGSSTPGHAAVLALLEEHGYRQGASRREGAWS